MCALQHKQSTIELFQYYHSILVNYSKQSLVCKVKLVRKTVFTRATLFIIYTPEKCKVLKSSICGAQQCIKIHVIHKANLLHHYLLHNSQKVKSKCSFHILYLICSRFLWHIAICHILYLFTSLRMKRT